MIKIDRLKAMEIIKEFDLQFGSSFTNTEPSHLSSQYIIETGFFLEKGDECLIKLKSYKEDIEDEEIIHVAYISNNIEAYISDFSEEKSLDNDTRNLIERIGNECGVDNYIDLIFDKFDPKLCE